LLRATQEELEPEEPSNVDVGMGSDDRDETTGDSVTGNNVTDDRTEQSAPPESQSVDSDGRVREPAKAELDGSKTSETETPEQPETASTAKTVDESAESSEIDGIVDRIKRSLFGS
jgi:hypothetical protein